MPHLTVPKPNFESRRIVIEGLICANLPLPEDFFSPPVPSPPSDSGPSVWQCMQDWPQVERARKSVGHHQRLTIVRYLWRQERMFSLLFACDCPPLSGPLSTEYREKQDRSIPRRRPDEEMKEDKDTKLNTIGRLIYQTNKPTLRESESSDAGQSDRTI
jgi:hypothetical protein